MAEQGERYDAKTKTGWKFEKGRSNYYLKGRKLSTREVVTRGLGNFTRDFFEPITAGAVNLKDKLRIHPKSVTGESVFDYNRRIAKEQLALKKKLDKNPNVVANRTAASTLSPSQYFGTGNFGDKAMQTANIRNIDNLQISAEHRRNVAKNPWAVENMPGRQVAISNAGTGFVKPGDPGFNLQRDVISNQGTDKESVVGNPISNTLKIDSAIPKAAVENETENRKSLKSNVFTRHYKTGKELGVMTRNQRKAYEKEAAGRVCEGGGGTRWVGANSTWVDRNNNVIAPHEP